MATKKIKKSYMLQPASRRLSAFFGGRPYNGRRAKKIQVKFAGIKWQISFRYFRTNKTTRTIKYQQYVLETPFSIKEIAFTRLSRRRFSSILSPAKAVTVFSLVIGVAGFIYFGAHLTTMATLDVRSSSSGHVKAATVDVKHLAASQPDRLYIDKIGVDTALTNVGLKPDGSLDVPADYHIAGWYSSSPTPGEIGPSVIDGHVDNHEGLGVFWRLRELAPGDTIRITRQDSSVATFKVDAVRQFPQDNFPTDLVYGKINYAGVRLITCGGVFNSDTHHYSDNIVVFGSLL
jgi:hypothetical protein